MKTFLTTVLSLVLMAGLQADESAPDLPESAVPVVQNWLHQNTEVVEVCVFRERWIAPTEQLPKGKLLKHATITRVHKGTVQVGERLIMSSLVEYPRETWAREARLRPDRVSLVDGELMVLMFNRERTPHENGYWDVGSDISRFRFDSPFYHAFLSEKKRDPNLPGAPH